MCGMLAPTARMLARPVHVAVDLYKEMPSTVVNSQPYRDTQSKLTKERNKQTKKQSSSHLLVVVHATVVVPRGLVVLAVVARHPAFNRILRRRFRQELCVRDYNFTTVVKRVDELLVTLHCPFALAAEPDLLFQAVLELDLGSRCTSKLQSTN